MKYKCRECNRNGYISFSFQRHDYLGWLLDNEDILPEEKHWRLSCQHCHIHEESDFSIGEIIIAFLVYVLSIGALLSIAILIIENLISAWLMIVEILIGLALGFLLGRKLTQLFLKSRIKIHLKSKNL